MCEFCETVQAADLYYTNVIAKNMPNDELERFAMASFFYGLATFSHVCGNRSIFNMCRLLGSRILQVGWTQAKQEYERGDGIGDVASSPEETRH